MVTMLLVAGAALAVVITAGFAVLVAGIQVSERRASLAGPPGCLADAFARFILGARATPPQLSPVRLAGATAQRLGSPAPSSCSLARQGSTDGLGGSASSRPGESS